MHALKHSNTKGMKVTKRRPVYGFGEGGKTVTYKVLMIWSKCLRLL
jgi:hypothetical protein